MIRSTLRLLFLIVVVMAPGLGSAKLAWASQPEVSGGRVYEVRPGETLSSVALKLGTTPLALIDANLLLSPYILHAKMRLQVPPDANVPPELVLVEPPPQPQRPLLANEAQWIEVDLREQKMYVYEYDHLVRSTLISSGRSKTPTVVGRYRVYAKTQSKTMTGGSIADGSYYNTPNVPWILWFYEGYSLHGAYWHNNFGHPMSHGCVNLPVPEAKWLYDWAKVGTLVVIHT